jgi:hypothetical protein
MVADCRCGPAVPSNLRKGIEVTYEGVKLLASHLAGRLTRSRSDGRKGCARCWLGRGRLTASGVRPGRMWLRRGPCRIAGNRCHISHTRLRRSGCSYCPPPSDKIPARLGLSLGGGQTVCRLYSEICVADVIAAGFDSMAQRIGFSPVTVFREGWTERNRAGAERRMQGPPGVGEIVEQLTSTIRGKG